MTSISYLYNHLTTRWEAIESDDVAPNIYRVPNLPGDEEKYMEIPATVSLRSFHGEAEQHS